MDRFSQICDHGERSSLWDERGTVHRQAQIGSCREDILLLLRPLPGEISRTSGGLPGAASGARRGTTHGQHSSGGAGQEWADEICGRDSPPEALTFVRCVPEVRSAKPAACPRCGMALEPEMPAAATRVEYTCPMHPEIVRPGPGSCPICGMALEPRTVTAQEEDNPELRDMTRRFWISLALTAPLLVIAMGHMLPGMPMLLPPRPAALDRIASGHAGGAVGRRAVLPNAAGRPSSIAPPTCSR